MALSLRFCGVPGSLDIGILAVFLSASPSESCYEAVDPKSDMSRDNQEARGVRWIDRAVVVDRGWLTVLSSTL